MDAEEGDGAGGDANDEENGNDNLLDEEVDVEEDYEGEDGDEDEDDGGRKHFVAADDDDAIKVEQDLIRVSFAFNSAHSSMQPVVACFVPAACQFVIAATSYNTGFRFCLIYTHRQLAFGYV